MSDLLPCPFCGGEAKIQTQHLLGEPHSWVQCESRGCGVSASPEAWKTRHTPEGWQLVPTEPTGAMQVAGEYAKQNGCYPSGIYADMLAAAPSPDQEV